MSKLLSAILGMVAWMLLTVASFAQTTSYTAYLVVGDTNPTTQVFRLSDGTYISNTDPTFLSWLPTTSLLPTQTITGAANNGSGLIRLTMASTASFQTNQEWNVFGVGGTTEANGVWKITVVDSTHIDLVGSTFSHFYTSGGAVTGPQVVATNTQAMAIYYASIAFVFSLNVGPIPTTPSGNVIRAVAADGLNGGILSDAYAAITGFTGRRAQGTAALPTAVQSGQVLTGLFSYGYGATGYGTSNSVIQTVSTENYSDTAKGSYIDFQNVANTTTSLVSRLRIEQDGGITVPPTVTGGSKGAGALNASTLYQANVQVATLSGTEELTNKTLTSSVGKGSWTASGTWTIAGLGTLGLRDTSAAFDVQVGATSATALTANRALTIDVGNAAQTLSFGAWSSATPTPSCGAGAITTATTSTRNKTLGKTTFFSGSINISNLGTCSSTLIIPLPSSSNGSGTYTMSCTDLSLGATNYCYVSTSNLVIGAPAAHLYYFTGIYEAN